jgi:DNA-binding MarR family transcriptional regulator
MDKKDNINNKEDFPELYLENQLCFPLYAASRLTIKIYAPYLKELDITYPQYLVLLVLWKQDRQRVNDIGENLFLESNTLTPLLKRLEFKKLINRKRSKSDERTVIISLTEKGKLMKNRAKIIPSKMIGSFSDMTLTEKELVEFKTTLLKLLNLLGGKTEVNQLNSSTEC